MPSLVLSPKFPTFPTYKISITLLLNSNMSGQSCLHPLAKIRNFIEIQSNTIRLHSESSVFCSLCTELRRFCCNLSHCSLSHCTMDCRFIVSTNLCFSVKSSSILQITSFILNDCLCCVEYSLPLQRWASF